MSEQILHERVQIGLAPQGLILNVLEGEKVTQAILRPDEAFIVAGQLHAIATILIQAQYAAVAQQRMEEQEFLAKTKGGKLWTPETT